MKQRNHNIIILRWEIQWRKSIGARRAILEYFSGLNSIAPHRLNNLIQTHYVIIKVPEITQANAVTNLRVCYSPVVT